MQRRGGGRQLLRHVLVAVFAMGSWVAVNALWVELPVVVKVLPEGWSLPAYLSVLVALGNVAPAAVALGRRALPGRRGRAAPIGAVQAVAAAAALLLALCWQRVAWAAGQRRSVPFLALAFVLAAACCTASVTFLPFMSRFPPAFVRTFFVGQGLGALLPCALALAQGAAQPACGNNGTGAGAPRERFPAAAFFWVLLALLAASALAFAALAAPARRHDAERHHRDDGRNGDEEEVALPLQDTAAAASAASSSLASPGPRWRVPFLLALQAAVSALANGVLPAVQGYASLPYGARAFHLAVVLASAANPLACLAAALLRCSPAPMRPAAVLPLMHPLRGAHPTAPPPHHTVLPPRAPRRAVLPPAILPPMHPPHGLPWCWGAVAVLGAALGGFLLALAALSPCPPLVGTSLGTAMVAGALLGAAAIFPPVSVLRVFRSGRGCGHDCAGNGNRHRHRGNGTTGTPPVLMCPPVPRGPPPRHRGDTPVLTLPPHRGDTPVLTLPPGTAGTPPF
ncbi:LOW QUALITY PROTEIN: solute carrier family 52, riboflavin transporter, member 2 [Eudromia elegans]